MRYMVENFAMFDYKTQEEVITVIKHLTMVLSTTGMQLLEMISPSHLLSQLHAPLGTASESATKANPDTVRFKFLCSRYSCSYLHFAECNGRRPATETSDRRNNSHS
jgi:hypothetical protein